MGDSIKKMVFSQAIYSIFKSFIMIFVNIYLWQTGESIQGVALFNMFNYTAAFLSFYIANKIALVNMKLNYIGSSLAFIMLFTITAIFQEGVNDYAALMGIFGGIGDGLFFFNMNYYQAYQLDREEADTFMSMVGMVTKASSIGTPVLSGIVISRFGFNAMIYVLLLLVTAQMVNGIFLPKTNIQSMFRINIKKMFRCKDQKRILLTHAIHAPYGQFIIMANSVFLYSFTRSEVVMGYLNTAFAIASILLYMVYLKLRSHFTRKTLTQIGVLALGLSIAVLFKPDFWTFVVFSLTVGLGDAFFNKPLTGAQIYYAKQYSEDERDVLGNLATRVLLLTTGRCIFYLLVFFFYEDYTSPIFTIFLGYNLISPYVSYRLAKKQME
ncbi:hypothetical protein SAMN05192551_10845 [Tindallia magadiensis]|uniref:Major Facilitator Superfamily protein n=1 Tax=Tindallia magadiensis TaxID=69895 RepID=A0A1I3G7I7_9FIRM|nr:hypothetical protein [Tindallia magadiensis]SFI19456.1 hypothetical protein SAMN05192551_10845 [Tindallia magadiensis]